MRHEEAGGLGVGREVVVEVAGLGDRKVQHVVDVLRHRREVAADEIDRDALDTARFELGTRLLVLEAGNADDVVLLRERERNRLRHLARRPRDQDLLAVHRLTPPPSTTIERPETQFAASLHSHTAASATCEGSPSLPPGIVAATALARSGLLANHPWIIGVSTMPGQTAFTRMLRSLYSCAAAFVRPSTPCFAAV